MLIRDIVFRQVNTRFGNKKCQFHVRSIGMQVTADARCSPRIDLTRECRNPYILVLNDPPLRKANKADEDARGMAGDLLQSKRSCGIELERGEAHDALWQQV